MFRAHRQAWAWQDEWHGMTMDDIRELERQTQLALQKKMGLDGSGGSDGGNGSDEEGDLAAAAAAETELSAEQSKHSQKMSSIEKLEDTPMFAKKQRPTPMLRTHPPSADDSGDDDDDDDDEESGEEGDSGAEEAVAAAAAAQKRRTLGASTGLSAVPKAGGSKFGSKGALHSPIGSTHSFDLQVFISMFITLSMCISLCLSGFGFISKNAYTFFCMHTRTPPKQHTTHSHSLSCLN